MSQKSAFLSFVKLFIVVLLLAGGGYWWWKISRPVFQVDRVKRGKAVNAVSGSVIVREEIPTPVRSPVSGMVSEANLEIGAVVKAGDFLVQLDTGDVDLEIRTTEESIHALAARIEAGSEAELQLKGAEFDFQNSQFAFKNNLMSPVEFKKAEIAFEGAKLRVALEKVGNEARLAELKTTLEVRKRQREKMTIKSPVDGQIADVVARKGSLISSEALLLTIISTTRTIEAKISEENFAGVSVGKKARIRFLKYGWQQFEGSVAKVLPMADPLTQRKVIYLNVDLPPEQLDPGLTGEVVIVVDEREGALIVPRRALVGGKVYVVKDGVVELRTVKTGFVGMNEAEITENVSESELVLVEQLELVRPGDRIRTQLGAR